MKAKVQFKKAITEKQQYRMPESKDDVLVCKLIFDLWVDDKPYPNQSVDISQPHGTDFDTTRIEVHRFSSEDYKGGWNDNELSDACNDYYRRCFGSQGQAVRTGSGTAEMEDCAMEVPSPVYEFEITDTSGGC